jgi:hypothetical protein
LRSPKKDAVSDSDSVMPKLAAISLTSPTVGTLIAIKSPSQ